MEEAGAGTLTSWSSCRSIISSISTDNSRCAAVLILPVTNEICREPQLPMWSLLKFSCVIVPTTSEQSLML